MGPDYRIPFREFGLSIGLHAARRLKVLVEDDHAVAGLGNAFGPAVESLLVHEPLVRAIEEFWLLPEHQKTEAWTAHRDINMVMLATSLSPEGFIRLS